VIAPEMSWHPRATELLLALGSAARELGTAARDAFQREALAPCVRQLFGPFEVSGAEVLERVAGPVIFAANHASHLDAPAVLAALPERRRRELMIAAAEDYFFSTRTRGWLTTAILPAFPFRRSGDVRCSLIRTEELIAGGCSVLLFPEGTRSSDGWIGPFRRGVALIAARSGVPVVPTYIDGAAAAWPKGARLPRRRPVAVSFGEPLRIGDTSSKAAFTDEVRERVLELREARRRGG